MSKILPDDEVLKDFRAKESPFKDYGPPEVVGGEVTEHEFMVGTIRFTCYAQEGGEIDLTRDSGPDDILEGPDALNNDERRQLQAGIDATIMKLRAKHGRPVGVIGGLVPMDWPE
jgi:hypothetical protein